ncbi:uncharacterized protein [Watersipora subatra]|uniref:uncharacterized protein n=1 Tax=Watersipora subatra TaxID=2589382 RepID=UPI00355BD70D
MSMIPVTTVLRKVKPAYHLKNKCAVNHLLYMDDLKLYGKYKNKIETLIHTVKIFSDDIGMVFGLDKRATITMIRGKLTGRGNIMLPNETEIHELEDNESYKYLGVMEADDIKQSEMKAKIKKEYIHRLMKVPKSKLTAGNLITAINIWAVSLYRYGAGIIQWTKTELQQLDRRTRKLMTMHKGLHPRSDVDRVYVERDQGGRGLMSVEETVNFESHSPKKVHRRQPSRIYKNSM